MPASRPACDTEALETQVIGEREHVVRLVGNLTAQMAVGATVPGPVAGDKAHPEPAIEILVGPALEPAARRPVELDDWKSIGIAPDSEGERAPVGGRRRPKRLAHDGGTIRHRACGASVESCAACFPERFSSRQ